MVYKFFLIKNKLMAAIDCLIISFYRINLNKIKHQCYLNLPQILYFTHQFNRIIRCSDPKVRSRIIKISIRRAKIWLCLKKKDVDSTLALIMNRGSKVETSINRISKYQVGGISPNKKPMLFLKSLYILKPLREDDRGFREVAFYESIRIGTSLLSRDLQGISRQRSSKYKRSYSPALTKNTITSILGTRYKEKNRLIRRLSNITASYYGLVTINNYLYIMLSDATASFNLPSVIDIKIGKQTFEPSALPLKVQKETAKYLKQDFFGFRIVGMRVHDASHPDADSSGFRTFDKSFGRSLDTLSKIKCAFAIFFGYKIVRPKSKQITDKEITEKTLLSGKTILNDNDHVFSQRNAKKKFSSILKVASHLRHVREWFKDNNFFSFYASSLLIVYEGDRVNLKMIDFTRVRIDNCGDKNDCLHGIQTLISILDDFLKDIY